MTPLISELIRFAPNPESFMWFDAGKLHNAWFDKDNCYNSNNEQIRIEDAMQLPFPRTAIAATDARNEKFVICLLQGESSVTATGFKVNPLALLAPFAYVYDPADGIKIITKDQGRIAEYRNWFKTIASVLIRINVQVECFKPTANDTFINRKRIAKGKSPLSFSWHTVTIEPKKIRSQSLGGSHASPRLHDRRGHWRTYKSGKKVWIKACKVGDASKGVVFKDYQVKQSVSAVQ